MVEGDHARPVKQPPMIEEEGGASCGVRRAYGRVDGMPALIQEKYDHTPSMSATTVVVTWDGDLSPSACAITFSYAPLFGKSTWLDAKDACEGPLCDGLRAASRDLVEAVQSPGQLRARLQGRLTPAQRAEYDAAIHQTIRNRGLVSDVRNRREASWRTSLLQRSEALPGAMDAKVGWPQACSILTTFRTQWHRIAAASVNSAVLGRLQCIKAAAFANRSSTRSKVI